MPTMTSEAPVGSTWYDAGHHWVVLEEREVDGEPGVLLKITSGKGKLKLPRKTRLLLKYATRTDV